MRNPITASRNRVEQRSFRTDIRHGKLVYVFSTPDEAWAYFKLLRRSVLCTCDGVTISF